VSHGVSLESGAGSLGEDQHRARPDGVDHGLNRATVVDKDAEEELRRRERERGELPTGRPQRREPGTQAPQPGADVPPDSRSRPAPAPDAEQAPSEVRLDEVAERAPRDPAPAGEGPGDGGGAGRSPRRYRDSSILIGLGVGLIACWALLQLGNGSSASNSNGNGSVAGQTSSTSQSTTSSSTQSTSGGASTTDSGTTAESTPTVPPPPRPVELWRPRTIGLTVNTVGLDSSTPDQNVNSGFNVGEAPGTPGMSLKGDGAGLAAWTGGGTPGASDCKQAAQGDSAALRRGEWICATDQAGNVLRFRYGGTDGTTFRFFITVWDGSTVP
jgi:hypothetical protein